VQGQIVQAKQDLALANRIVAHEGVLDAFGHISVRHPTDPGRYLMSGSRAPALVAAADILEFTLDSQPVGTPKQSLYGERVIHGAIYQARPDVQAVCHHHSADVLPFCISGMPLVPVFHLGGTLGAKVPFWDQRDDFGDTNLLVIKPEEGASLARALGPHWIVLMRRHGATVAGTSLRELVFRTIYTCRNAELQLRAHTLGHVGALNAAETEGAGTYNLRPGPISRAYEYWTARLLKAEGPMAAAVAAPPKARLATKSKAKPPARKATAGRGTKPQAKRPLRGAKRR
jgi:ribulose-5-phosphate 4-epimerase/fuculose-1-phosphate aldolase